MAIAKSEHRPSASSKAEKIQTREGIGLIPPVVLAAFLRQDHKVVELLQRKVGLSVNRELNVTSESLIPQIERGEVVPARMQSLSERGNEHHYSIKVLRSLGFTVTEIGSDSQFIRIQLPKGWKSELNGNVVYFYQKNQFQENQLRFWFVLNKPSIKNGTAFLLANF